MSGFAAVPRWLVEAEDVSAHEKLVYMVLSCKIGDQGAWFTGHSEIAAMAGISVSSVKRALLGLRERNVVTWTERYDSASGARLGNSYRLMTDRLGQSDPPPRSEGPTPQVSVTEQNKNPEIETPYSPPESTADQQFDALWEAWPKSTEKKRARERWLKLSQSKRAKILPVLLSHARWMRKNRQPEYVPNLATYILQERWDDELPGLISDGSPSERRTPVAGGPPVYQDGGIVTAEGLTIVYSIDHYHPIGYQREDDPRPQYRQSLDGS